MRFSTFVENTVVTKDAGVISLTEGIDHIEALPPEKFISVVKNINKFIASEKLDGANLIFGFENDGRFYTSREAKRGGRMYDTADYDNSPASNGFKSAHAALESVKAELKAVMDDGEAAECEVLFGRQPNAIVYGTSYIAFLRMVPGDNGKAPQQNLIKELADELRGKKVTVTTPIVTSNDGIELTTEMQDFVWKFVSTTFIDSKAFKDIDLSEELEKFKKFLKQPNNVGGMNLTNSQLMGIKLTSVPKDIRPEVKEERDRLIKIAEERYKLGIKEQLLDRIVRKLDPALRDVEISPHEDTGIEGLVFLDPDTLEQFKIVDKDVFTIINQFNFAIRNQVKSTSRGRMVFDKASLGRDLDIFNELLEKLAKTVGNEGLSHYTALSREIKKYKGETKEETLKNFVQSFRNKDFNTVKQQTINHIETAIDELTESLNQYKSEWQDYELELKTGKTIKYSEEVHNRTLLVFAETRRELNDMLKNVKQADNLGDIAVALYGKMLNRIH